MMIAVEKKDEEKENKSMSTSTGKNTNREAYEKEEKKMGLRGRLTKYWEENGATIVSGMMTMTGSSSAYRTYCMMDK